MGNKTPQAAVAALQFPADESVADAVQAGAVVSVDRAAEQTELSDGGDEFVREAMRLESRTHERNRLRVDEAGDALGDHAFVVGEFRVDVEEIQRIEFAVSSAQ